MSTATEYLSLRTAESRYNSQSLEFLEVITECLKSKRIGWKYALLILLHSGRPGTRSNQLRTIWSTSTKGFGGRGSKQGMPIFDSIEYNNTVLNDGNGNSLIVAESKTI